MASEHKVNKRTQNKLLPLFETAIEAAESHVQGAKKQNEPFYLTIERDFNALRTSLKSLLETDKLEIVDDPQTERSSILRIHGTFNFFTHLDTDSQLARNNPRTISSYKAMAPLFEYLENNTFTIC